MVRRTSGKKPPRTRDYRHGETKALMRPEAGAQENFPANKLKPPKTYRYDSSLAPELQWDEGKARSEGEQAMDEIINAETLDEAKKAARRLRDISKPFLNWAGKAERGEFTVPSMPLFVHERLSTKAVLDTLHRKKRDRQETLGLFNEGGASIGDKILGAYEHANGWQNRMILGDSLQVMNSLLAYENMGRQARMIYMDPPYGIKFGGNFQPFVKRRDVKDGDDKHFTREPEMVRAYRDTWTLGTHSWLTYMRDRLLLARDLLADNGSCFVQISDENVHFVRCVMDEVFGQDNFVSLIAYKVTSGTQQKKAPRRIFDYLIWYARDREAMQFKRLFMNESIENDKTFSDIELPDGTRRSMTSEERDNPNLLPEGARPYRTMPLHAQGAGDNAPRTFNGQQYNIPANRHWAHTSEGFDRLVKANRIVAERTAIRAINYFDDFGYSEYTNNWVDTGPEMSKNYVVQTSARIIQRCMLMATKPGDLVIDPTCGSGTTAFVAEQWGRRWITMDVSRVPLALARQRLLTATYPYYRLQNEEMGPTGGFVYEQKQNRRGEEVGGVVPHVTLASIANDELAKKEVLADKPESEANTARITGPFCVEAVIPSAVNTGDDAPPPPVDIASESDAHITRMIEIFRRSPTLQLPQNKPLTLSDIMPCAKSMNLHAEAQSGSERLAVVFGPENAVVSERMVIDAGKEAHRKGYDRLLVAAFAVEAPARKTIDQGERVFNIPALYAQISMDVAMGDLLKNMRTSRLFAVSGLPDVALRRLAEKSDDGSELYVARLLGVDVFDPTTMETSSGAGSDVPCWMLDTSYDGQCFRAGQVFFPKTGAWDNIKRAVGMEFDDSVWSHLSGDESEPFVAGGDGQIAVKVIDARGNELLVVKSLEEAEETQQ